MFSHLCRSCWFVLFFRDPFWFVWGEDSLWKDLRTWTWWQTERLCFVIYGLITDSFSLLLLLNLFLFLVNITWAFLTPTCKKATTTCSTLPPLFKDGFVRRWNQQSVALYRSRCNSPRWVKPSGLTAQYCRKTLHIKKVLKRVFFHTSNNFCQKLIAAVSQAQHFNDDILAGLSLWLQAFSILNCIIFCQLYNIKHFHRSSGSPCCWWQNLGSVRVQTFSPQMNEKTWNTFRSELEGRCSQRRLAWTLRHERLTGQSEWYHAECFSNWSFSCRNRNVTHDNEMKGIVGAVVIMRIGG